MFARYDLLFFCSSCGKVMPGCKTKLDNPDKDGNGEICFWGRHVFMGYLNMPDKTMEAIDPEGWLHSGDLGKHDHLNFLYITGRIKGKLLLQSAMDCPMKPISETMIWFKMSGTDDDNSLGGVLMTES